jgi:photosystem II stability/assembly factor-like uncharacterized protein
VGASASFTLTGYDTTGVPVPGVSAAWATYPEGVASISSLGQVRGLVEGSARVYAVYDSLVDSAVVVVIPAQDGWFVQASNANNADLHGVHFRPGGRYGWAVGDGGKIVATIDGGANWAAQVSNTTNPLQDVWFTSTAKGWAVGNGGTVMHTTDGGATWTRLLNVGTTVVLNDVWFADDSTGWVVGETGIILKTTDEGASWSRTYIGGQVLNSVAFSGADGWAVGQSGIIVGTHDSGANWFIVQPFVTSFNLRAVWRRSEPMAVAVGAAGSSPYTEDGPSPSDTTHWNLRALGASYDLYGVHFPNDLVGFAVGDQGTGLVLRTSDGGATWGTPQISNAQFRLEDVFFVDEDRGWAVGRNGIIIHTGTGGAP